MHFILNIHGESWTVIDTKLPMRGFFGACDHQRKLIYIREKHPHKLDKASTLQHELTHALLPDLSEQQVENIEAVLYKGLVAFGYGNPDVSCKPMDYTGKRFKYRLIYGAVGRDKWGAQLWLAECHCGHLDIILAHDFNRSCKKCGIQRTKIQGIRDNAFTLQTPEADFWAGVLAADGSVTKNRITLGFKQSDLGFLEQWRDWVGSKHKIDYRTKTTKDGKKFKSCYNTFSSGAIVKDLLSYYNITERKSLTLIPPANRATLPFVAGLWAGDGTIGRYKNKYGTYNWTIAVCGTKPMMEMVQQQFKIFSKAKVKRVKANLFEISYHGNKLCQTIGKTLLANSVFRLDRKVKLLEQLVHSPSRKVK